MDVTGSHSFQNCGCVLMRSKTRPMCLSFQCELPHLVHQDKNRDPSVLKVTALANRAATNLSLQIRLILGASQPSSEITNGSYVLLAEKPSAFDATIILLLGNVSDSYVQTVTEKLHSVRLKDELAVCISTKPFIFEGRARQTKAELTLRMLKQATDLLVVVEHDAFLKKDALTVTEASTLSNNTILRAVQAISQLISGASVFYDAAPCSIRTIHSSEILSMLRSSGMGRLGFGEGCSIVEAVERACLESPFISESISGVEGVVILTLASKITPTVQQIRSAAVILRNIVGNKAGLICGLAQDTALGTGTFLASIITTECEQSKCLKSRTPTVDTTIESTSGALDKLQDMVSASAVSRRAKAKENNMILSWSSVSASEWQTDTRKKLSEDAGVGFRKSEEELIVSALHKPLPHDPGAIPRGSVVDMGVGVVMDICSSLLRGKELRADLKQPSLSERAASMLESERSEKSLAPAVEMDFKSGTFKGRCEGGVPDGKGRLTYADGSFYDGNWIQGKREGMGMFCFANGDMYQGLWLDDVMHGKGWFYFHSGDRLHAEFVQGKVNGEGRYYRADGSVHFGLFKDNWRHGDCLLKDSSGCRWMEVWNNGTFVARKKLSAS